MRPLPWFKNFLICIFSSALLALSFPTANLWILAWLGFVPLFFAIRNTSKKRAFLVSYLTGVLFWLGTIFWLHHVSWPGFIGLVLYLSLYFGIFGICFNLFSKSSRLSTFNILLVPAVWTSFEFLRSTGPTGFGWALLGYSQYLNIPLIQIADVTGVWGVSFLVMMVNVAVYAVMTKQSRITGTAVLTFLLVLFSLSYGFYKLYLLPTPGQVPLRISIVQGNIPQEQKWDEEFKDLILARYEILTEKAAREEPDLIIWPETALPGLMSDNPVLLIRISALAKHIKTPLLIGAVTTDSTSYTRNYYNSALLVSEKGRIVKQYDKRNLVPFGEYIPFERYIPFFRYVIDKPIGDYTPGDAYTIFELKNPRLRRRVTRFGVLICFEDTFPRLVRQFVNDGADFMINCTNDAWFMRSSAPYQHAQASVFRAVENRVPVVRAANTGLSCFIDKYGRIYDKVMVDDRDIFVVGYKTSNIALE